MLGMHACMHMPSICKNLGVCMHAGYQLEVSGFSGKFLVDVYLGNHRGTLQGKWNTHILSHRLRQTDRFSHRTHRLTQTHPHTHTHSVRSLSHSCSLPLSLSLSLSHTHVPVTGRLSRENQQLFAGTAARKRPSVCAFAHVAFSVKPVKPDEQRTAASNRQWQGI